MLTNSSRLRLLSNQLRMALLVRHTCTVDMLSRISSGSRGSRRAALRAQRRDGRLAGAPCISRHTRLWFAHPRLAVQRQRSARCCCVAAPIAAGRWAHGRRSMRRASAASCVVMKTLSRLPSNLSCVDSLARTPEAAIGSCELHLLSSRGEDLCRTIANTCRVAAFTLREHASSVRSIRLAQRVPDVQEGRRIRPHVRELRLLVPCQRAVLR